MALYQYKKETNGHIKKILTTISYTSMTIGVLFLFWSFYPVLASEVYSRVFISQSLASPVSSTDQDISAEKEGSIKGFDDKFSTNLVDYTKASSWFTNVDEAIKLGTNARPDIKEYKMSIPKIGIDNARVFVGGDDLLSGVVHYVPQSMPGEVGTVNLFGHSSLLQLYKPDDYKHIFSYVPFLEKGDIMYINIDSVKYTYEIYDKVVVKPSEVEVLQQHFDNSYINLITCVPHGTYINRAVVKARLKELPQ